MSTGIDISIVNAKLPLLSQKIFLNRARPIVENFKYLVKLYNKDSKDHSKSFTAYHYFYPSLPFFAQLGITKA